ncbi:MAG: CXXX repeat peptide modification system protein [Prevotella sp.]|nr:CXXX repeat peptide modification system protein [Prevotella sp.]
MTHEVNTPSEEQCKTAHIERNTSRSLLCAIRENSELYEKLVKDMGETGTKFQQWWDVKAKQHGWESHPNGNWEINFQSCEITLVVNE